MKGLLIKDLKLMKNNGKNLLLVFLIIGTMMGIMTKRTLCGSWICHFYFYFVYGKYDQL